MKKHTYLIALLLCLVAVGCNEDFHISHKDGGVLFRASHELDWLNSATDHFYLKNMSSSTRNIRMVYLYKGETTLWFRRLAPGESYESNEDCIHVGLYLYDESMRMIGFINCYRLFRAALEKE